MRGLTIDDDERRALELELAAELADMAYDFGSDSSVVAPVIDEFVTVKEIAYVHRDLDEMLREIGRQHEEEAKRRKAESSSWGMLLQTVDECEQGFFGAFQADLDDIRATILAPTPDHGDVTSIPSSETSETVQVDSVPTDPDSIPHPPTLEQSELTVDTAESEESNQAIANESLPVAKLIVEATVLPPANKDSNPPSNLDERLAYPPSLVNGYAAAVPSTSIDHCEDTTEATGIDLSDSRCEISDNDSGNSSPDVVEDDTPVQKVEDETISGWVSRAQERWMQEQAATASWLSQLELDYAEMEQEQNRRDQQRREARECILLSHEEWRSRKWVEWEQECRETSRMVEEEHISLQINYHWRSEERRLVENRGIMEAEDLSSQMFAQFEKEKERAQRLLDEHCAIRRQFNTALNELVDKVQAKLVAQQKLLELESRKQRRECALMRSEEAYQRRVVAQSRALELEKVRALNRILMSNEDQLSMDVERAERRRRAAEEQSRRDMNDEDCRSAKARAFWHEQLARQRQQEQQQKRLAAVSAGADIMLNTWRRKRFRMAVWVWKHRVHVVVELERVQQRVAVVHIQRWYRRCRFALVDGDNDSIEGSEPEGNECWGDGADSAAMVVQSVFRGFFVRRKFAAALELAGTVGCDEDGDFDEVNIDDLIQLPPELEDGWENPVLPSVTREAQRSAPTFSSLRSQQNDLDGNVGTMVNAFDDTNNDDDVDDREEDDPTTCDYNSVAAIMRTRGPPVTNSSSNNNNNHREAASPPKETNLAASLWNKMRRNKQKQKRIAEERSRQQDPVYRVQKLLQPKKKSSPAPSHQHGAPPSNTQTTSVAWTSSNNAPKPKVKLPSLVERLRKKTEAERANG